MKMKFLNGFWILWMTISRISAPGLEKESLPLQALSFVLSSNNVYELEDILALQWRNHGMKIRKFYFSNIIFACPEFSENLQMIEEKPTTKNVLFINNVVEEQCVKYIKTPPTCKKEYYPMVVAVIQQGDEYHIGYEYYNNSHRQEFRIGFEVSDVFGKLGMNGLPAMERFAGMAEGSSWLESLRVIYDMKNLVVRQVSYELNFMGFKETIPVKCKNFKVGNNQNIFKDIRFEVAYNVTNQLEGVLKDVVRPTRPKTQSTNKVFASRAATKTYRKPPAAASKQFQKIKPDESPFKKPQDRTPQRESRSVKSKSMESASAEPIDLDQSAPESVNTEAIENECQGDKMIFEEQCSTDTLLDLKIGPPQPTAQTSRKRNTQNDKSQSEKRITIESSVRASTSKEPSTEDQETPQELFEDEEYFIMQQLAPVEYFDVVNIRWSTCTHFNVAPMWRSLATGSWRKVDLAIRELLYFLDNLFVVAGTHRVLKLPIRDSDRYKEIYLQANTRDITVPHLFYKLVVHKVFPPDQEALLYGIVIVMHNDLDKPTNRICPNDPDDLCFMYGWDVNNSVGYPYCCKPTLEILKLLDIRFPPLTGGDFNLNEVVVNIDANGKRIIQNYSKISPRRK